MHTSPLHLYVENTFKNKFHNGAHMCRYPYTKNMQTHTFISALKRYVIS